MLAILLVTFPFFALVLCGYVAARRGLLPLAAIPGLNSFVLFFALPCMLYRFGASTPIAQLLDFAVLGVYLVCALLMVGVTLVLTRRGPLRRLDWNNAAFGALVAAFPNTGFMGVPLLVALLGAQAAGPVIAAIALDMLITSSLCIALSRLDQTGSANGAAGTAAGGAAAQALKQAVKGVLSNPMPWAIVLGGLASANGWLLPLPLAKTLGLLADAASPVALFTIGAVLARSQINHDSAAPGHTHWTDYVPLALLKLLLHPLLMGLVGSAAIAWGAALSPFALVVLVLVAALPSASNVSLLAERFGADNGRIARIILVSTATAFLTFSAVVALLT
ncbi:MAG: AEC family transporter [Burkholderiales bacterium]